MKSMKSMKSMNEGRKPKKGEMSESQKKLGYSGKLQPKGAPPKKIQNKIKK